MKRDEEVGRFPIVTVVLVPDEAMRRVLEQSISGLDVDVWDVPDDPPESLPRARFLVPDYLHGPVDNDQLAKAARLEVIQLLTAGVESWLDRVPAGVTLCNGRGIHGASTAELGVAGLLAVIHRLPEFVHQQDDNTWKKRKLEDLQDKSVLIVGAGDIGAHFAAAVKVFGAKVAFVARTRRDGVGDLADLDAALADSDIVVLALPLTEETRGFFDSSRLAKMHDGAILVNIARGALIDTEALTSEVCAGRIRAFLDVVDPEPLPAEHRLWSAPNVVITPHVGGGTGGWELRAQRLVVDQVQRFVNGDPLHNVVSESY